MHIILAHRRRRRRGAQEGGHRGGDGCGRLISRRCRCGVAGWRSRRGAAGGDRKGACTKSNI